MIMEIISRGNLLMEGVKEEVGTLRKMEVISKGILGIMLLMVLENTSIDRDTSIKVYGRIIWQMVKEKLTTLMEVVIMVNFLTIKDMEKEY